MYGMGEHTEQTSQQSQWARMKLARARQHISHLGAAIDMWLADDPYSVELDYGDDHRTLNVTLRVRTPPPVRQWALIVGDCIHNMRSALDATVWRLAHLDGRTATDPRGLYFPVVTQGQKWDSARKKLLQTVPDDYAERIRNTQPFIRVADQTETDPLYALHYLSKLDKHRESIVVTVDSLEADHKLQFEVESVDGSEDEPEVESWEPELRDGFLLASVKSRNPILSTTGSLGIQPAFLIAHPAGEAELMQTLTTMVHYFSALVDHVWNVDGDADGRVFAP
jgi:hypothetical protein